MWAFRSLRPTTRHRPHIQHLTEVIAGRRSRDRTLYIRPIRIYTFEYRRTACDSVPEVRAQWSIISTVRYGTRFSHVCVCVCAVHHSHCQWNVSWMCPKKAPHSLHCSLGYFLFTSWRDAVVVFGDVVVYPICGWNGLLIDVHVRVAIWWTFHTTAHNAWPAYLYMGLVGVC